MGITFALHVQNGKYSVTKSQLVVFKEWGREDIREFNLSRVSC
jgi:hypothetical protein